MSPKLQKWFGNSPSLSKLTSLWKSKASMENGSEGFYHGVTVFSLVVSIVLIVLVITLTVAFTDTKSGRSLRKIANEMKLFTTSPTPL
jgi:hypothetical protein